MVTRKTRGGRPPIPDAERKVLDAAARCIVRSGISKVTMSDVAARAGLSRPTVYRLFDDRGCLIEAVVARALSSFASAMTQAVGPRDDPLELLVELMLYGLREVPRDPLLSRVLEGGAYATFPGSPAAEAVSLAPVRTALTAYRALIPGLRPRQVDDLSELLSRISVSALVFGAEDTLTTDARSTRRKLRAWLGPIVAEHVSTTRRAR